MHPGRLFGKLVFIVFLVLPAAVWAALPLVTDDTGTQGKGKFQVEASGTWSTDENNENGEGGREIDNLADVTLTAGIFETVDLSLDVPYLWTKVNEGGQTTNDNGYSDMVLAAKWRFLEFEKQKLSMAIKPGLLLPTGNEDKGLGTGKVGYLFTFITTFELLEPWAFDLNLAYYDLENKENQRNNLWSGSLAARFKASEAWTLVGEVGSRRNADKFDSSHPAFAQVGVIYSLKEYLDLSAGFIWGLTDTEMDEAIKLGMTVRF